jgi:hypothetical protein
VFPCFLLVLTVVRDDAEPVEPMNAPQFGAILIFLGFVVYFPGERVRKKL